MLHWLPLVWANLKRRKLRSALTFACILLSFLLFGLLDALRSSLSGAINLAGADRLMMTSKINVTVSLPIAYYEKVKATPGVRAAVPFTWFGGIYKDSRNQIQVQVTKADDLMAVYPELILKPGEFEAWKHDRQGMIVGPGLANIYGWKVGDRVPIRSDIWRKEDGSDTWEMNIIAIYDSSGTGIDRNSTFLHFDYFNESLQYGKDAFSWMTIRVANPDESDALAARIDAQFANSASETRTATERVFIKQVLEQIGNIGLILVSVTTAVFFTMLLVTANTMARSVAERTNEIGVLKTLGFSGHSILTLVLLEALFLTFSAGLLGMGLAWLAAKGLGEVIKNYFPVFELSQSTFIAGISMMLVFGVVTGLWPALTAMRLKIVDALRTV